MQIYITDKTGQKFWNTNVSYQFSAGELSNMKQRLLKIKMHAPGWAFVDSESARIVELVDQDERQQVEKEDEYLLSQLA